MNEQLAYYGCSALMGTNKAGNLKDLGNSYREITLGAFDIHNSAGEFYDFTSKLKKLFEPGSVLMRRIANGQLRSELNHPKPLPGQSFAAFLSRINTIDMEKVSGHIRAVRLEAGKDHQGNNVVLVIGEVGPSGPYGPGLEASFNNADENVAFSIRSITKTQVVKGVRHKQIQMISTWDQVHEPGIAVATKYNTPSLEAIDDDMGFTELELNMAIANEEASPIGVEEGISSTLVRDALGWNKIQLIKPKSSLDW